MEAIKTLKDLGYAFNAEGELRKVNSAGGPGEEVFQFNVSNDHQECQAHYEKLGGAVTEYVYQMLENHLKLIRLPVPKDIPNGTFIFASRGYDKKEELLILIHGSGVVRAGQWARSLIINENIDTGTQVPYIKEAFSRDYGVIVLNSNDNYYPNGNKIPYSGSAEEHAEYVWQNYIANTKASFIAIVAHSYGGVVTLSLAEKLKQQFEDRVKAVALTDSVHAYSNAKISKYLKQISRNWISSSAPLDEPINTTDHDIERVSAGMPLKTNAEMQKAYRERLKKEKPNKYEEIRVKHLSKVKENRKKSEIFTEDEKEVLPAKRSQVNAERAE